MLKTSEERVRLLKKGIKSKTIEELYIRHNKIKIIRSPVLFELKNDQIKATDPILIGVCAIASLSAISSQLKLTTIFKSLPEQA